MTDRADSEFNVTWPPGYFQRYVQQAREMIQSKINTIRECCTSVVGQTIDRFETAEILNDEGTWDDWPDLPIRIYCADGTLLSVSWFQFDDLWLSNDDSLPFPVEDNITRWKVNGLDKINAAVGKVIHGVMLGRGEMTVESRDIEIWTRLVFDLGSMWFEVFNALDENGYDVHVAKPHGEFVNCT